MRTCCVALAVGFLVACSDPEGAEQMAPPTSASTGPQTDGNAESSGGETSTSGSSSETSTSTSDDGSSTSGGPVPIELDRAWLEALEGSWVGPVDPTPTGPIPTFPLYFAWEDDGSLHARTDSPGGGYFDFRFHEQDGGWVFTEEGQLPGGMTQSYTLQPIERDGPRVRFVVPEKPEFLIVDITVQAKSFEMDVSVAGIRHAVFELSR